MGKEFLGSVEGQSATERNRRIIIEPLWQIAYPPPNVSPLLLVPIRPFRLRLPDSRIILRQRQTQASASIHIHTLYLFLHPVDTRVCHFSTHKPHRLSRFSSLSCLPHIHMVRSPVLHWSEILLGLFS